jgi:hypothetical protein
MNTCKKHSRYNCWDSQCQQDNAGRIGMDTQGDLTIGLGGGLAMDMSDGSLGMNIGGITFDFDGK